MDFACARQGKREGDGRWRERNGYRGDGSGGTEGENKAGETTGADSGCAGAKWKKSVRGGGPPGGYSGVGDGVGVVDADGTAGEKRVQTTSVHFHKYCRSDCLRTQRG